MIFGRFGAVWWVECSVRNGQAWRRHGGGEFTSGASGESAEWKRKEVACAHERTANRVSQHVDLGLVTAVVAKHAAVCTAWAILAWPVLVWGQIFDCQSVAASGSRTCAPEPRRGCLMRPRLQMRRCCGAARDLMQSFGRQGAEWTCRSCWRWKHRRFAGRIGPLEVYRCQAWKSISITNLPLPCIRSSHQISHSLKHRQSHLTTSH